jgi:peptide deformylase
MGNPIASQRLAVMQLGHPVLRSVALPIDNISDPAIQQLIDDLIETVVQANGVGIAAPQVGQSLQLMIVASRPNPRYPHAPEMVPTAMINPQVIAHSPHREKGWEGCLSVPGQRGWVPRYQSITVAYTDRAGQPQQVELTDFVARIFQHEYDHFHGLVFLDRVETAADLITEAAYQEMLKTSADDPPMCQNTPKP